MRLGVGRRSHDHPASGAVGIDFPRRAELLRHTGAGQRPICDAGVVGERHLPAGRVVVETFLRPGLQQQLDMILEDLPVQPVIVGIIRNRRRGREPRALRRRIVDRRRW